MDHKTTTYYVWKEPVTIAVNEQCLQTPWADPNIYEFPFDFIFESKKDAMLALDQWDAGDEAKESGWVLCIQTLEPIEVYKG